MFKKKLILFLVAAFSMTQIYFVGFIGISELVMLACGPFMLWRYYSDLKRDGFLPLITLAGLWVLSAIATDVYRETAFNDALKGVAPPVLILFMTPCLYVLLRDDLKAFKWGLIGFVVTLFLSTYIIQAGTSVSRAEMQGISARQAALEYKNTFMMFFVQPIRLFPSFYYLQAPVLSTVITLGLALFSLYEGGRGVFLSLTISAGILFLAGGRSAGIIRMPRKIILLVFMVLLLSYSAKQTYEYMVKNNYLGAAELNKYEMQVESKIGLLSGRSQFVSFFYAVFDSPILGHGSWVLDWSGYNVRAMEWLEEYENIKIYNTQGKVDYLNAHSHIMTAYLWHGVLGAVFWFYVLILLWRTIIIYVRATPEFFGYLALTVPGVTWAIMFSPLTTRVSTTFLLVVCLLVRRQYIAARNGQIIKAKPTRKISAL